MSHQQEEMLKIAVVARALKVSNQTVLRMVQSGELKAEMEGNAWHIPQSALRQHVLRLLGMSGSRCIFDRFGENIINLERKSQHSNDLARWYIQKTVENLTPIEFTPQDALARLDPLLRKLAWRFGKKDWALRDDMYQEMALGILLCSGTNFLTFYADRAESRARDLLRKERRRGMISFNRDVEHDEHPATAAKPDCSMVIELFKLAGMSLSLLAEFGIHLVDEGENHVSVRSEGNDHRDECNDGQEENVYQTPSAGSSEIRAA